DTIRHPHTTSFTSRRVQVVEYLKTPANMKLKNTLLYIIEFAIMCNSNISLANSLKAARSKCHTDKVYVHSGRRARHVMGAPTKKHDYGLEEDRVPAAFKLTEEFQYIQLQVNFGVYEYDSRIIKAEELNLKNDGKWHQLWFDLEPTDLSGVDNWHIYIKSEHTTVDIDTGYVWHWAPYKPSKFNVYARGKSYWIPRGNASVCNELGNEWGAGSYGRSGAQGSLLTEMNLVILLLPLLLLMRIVAAQAVD
ncbi:unnamed protein product, partial [Meganyctiphanes norvegica]